MRKKHITLLLVGLLPLMILSCVKEDDDNLDRQEKFYLNNPEAIAQVKFIHAYTPLTINSLSTSLATSGTGFRITMDGNKINSAINTSPATNTLKYGGQPDTTTYSASFFPTTSAYAFLPPGPRNIKFIMNRITSGNYAPITGDEVFTATIALTAGKKYSMFIADPYPTTGLLVEDNFTAPPLDQYAVRFINVSAETTTRYDVSTARHGIIFSNVGYKEMLGYKILTVPSILDTVYMKIAGTNTIVSQVNSFRAGSQRVYTMYARGKTGVTGRTPTINYYTNK